MENNTFVIDELKNLENSNNKSILYKLETFLINKVNITKKDRSELILIIKELSENGK